jgi:hypothetical protein
MLFGGLHFASLLSLSALVVLLIFGGIQTRPALPALVALIVAMEAFRFLGRREQNRTGTLRG